VACGGASDPGESPNPGPFCKCGQEPVILSEGSYVRKPVEPGAVSAACEAGGICGERAVVSAEEVELTFAKDGQTFRATFKVTSRSMSR
jgi:hypothetical protein